VTKTLIPLFLGLAACPSPHVAEVTTEAGAPEAAPPSVTVAPRVAVGRDHSCILQSNGTVRCCGANTNGQIGDGTLENRAAPSLVRDLAPASQLVAAGGRTCALLTTGLVRCWGENGHG